MAVGAVGNPAGAQLPAACHPSHERPPADSTSPDGTPSRTATSGPPRHVIAGYVESYEQDIADWNVTVESSFIDMDDAPFSKGAPNDQCQARHMGYVIKGTFGVRESRRGRGDREAGDAFVIEPGHTPLSFADSEFVAFTPSEEAKQQSEWVMPNIIKYAQERGIELPAPMTPAS